MAKAARVVGMVAGAVAFAASVALTFGATAVAGVALTTVSAVASATAVAANTTAAALQKPPPAQGSVSQVMIGNNLPVPLLLGRTYSGGLQVFDDSGGPDNRYRFQIQVVSGAGPIQEIEWFCIDYVPTSMVGEKPAGWYQEFMTVEFRYGTRPDTAFTSGGVAGISGFGAEHRRSGWACYRVAYKFDKDAKRYSGGLPWVGLIAKGVKVYDPRKDSTYPGGSGGHRWDDEATWEWDANTALNALMYARGRFVNGVKLAGMGASREAIDLPMVVEWANLCDANGWAVGGTVYEGPGTSKWDNLKRISQAGGAMPVFSNGVLTWKLSAPRPSLFTITADDLAGPAKVRSTRSWRDRKNSIVPRFRSEAHRWEYVQAQAITGSTYLAEDGELKTEEVQFDLVQNVNQAAQLAAYEMVNGRELGPIVLPLKPRLLRFRVGEAGTVHLPELGLVNQLAVIVGKQVDLGQGIVTLTLMSETAAKHAYALGQVGTPPPSPVLRAIGAADQVAGNLEQTTADISLLIKNSFAQGLSFTLDHSGVFTVSAHERVYADKVTAVNGGTLNVTAAAGDLVMVFYDDEPRSGGAVPYQHIVVPPGGATEAATTTPANPFRHFVAAALMPAPPSGGSGGTSGGGTNYDPGGGGGGGTGGGWFNNYQIV